MSRLAHYASLINHIRLRCRRTTIEDKYRFDSKPAKTNKEAGDNC
jgi:hypothetical protein